MIAVCVVTLGDPLGNHTVIPNNMVIACSCVESINNIPNGRVVLKVPNLAIDEIFKMPSNVPISVSMSSYEKTDGSDIVKETTKTFNGSIVKHYSMAGNNFSEKTVYVIEFITVGDNLSYLSILKEQAITNNSIGAIQELSELVGTTLRIDSSDIQTNDVMNWLVCRKNYLTAVDAILNRSYVSDSDALYLAYLGDNTVRLGSLSNSFKNPTNIVYFYGKHKIDIVNNPQTVGNNQTLVYFDSHISHSTAIMATINSPVVTVQTPPLNQNKKTSSTAGVTTSPPSGSNKVTGMVGGVVATSTTVTKGNSNTHDKYGISPSIRNSVYGRYSHKITISAAGESVVGIGDVVNVIVPTVAYQSSSNESTATYSKALSGAYFVTSKTYYFGDNFRFQVAIDLVSDSTTIDNNTDYLTNFGISKDQIK